MKHKIKFFLSSSIPLCCLMIISSAEAQIVPDGTLPNNSNITSQGISSSINGGTRVGSNLFHSFTKFSVPTGGTAFFNNPLDIQNIIGRVTGFSVSNIDGLIRANGVANLFLINPNGIIFGPNARLNIGGSFLGSTASSLNFADGTQFSATAPQTTPLLTISVPIGLRFGGVTSAIRVQGTGHNLIATNSGASPVIGAGSSLTGLRVQTGKTLALVGGNVNLEGGILTAPGGQIELGSVGNGSISFSPTLSNWSFGYQGVASFNDIYLSQRALADASGVNSGYIHVQGAHVRLRDGSVLLIQNQGAQPGGNLNVNAVESLEISGTSSDGLIRTGFLNETVGVGNGGEIAISTKRLTVQDGAGIVTATYSTGKGGNLAVNASAFTQILGYLPGPPLFSTVMLTTNYGSGNAGKLTLSTENLSVKGGAGVGSLSFGSGGGGDVTVNANSSVEIVGAIQVGSSLDAITFSSGDAGSLIVNTQKLEIRNGGDVSTATLASGKAGSLTIKASDYVDVSGTLLQGSKFPSAIDSSAVILSEAVQKKYRLPPLPSGTPGNVTINTSSLKVTNGALVSVQNQGVGNNAGSLRVNANSINLDNQGGITASTVNGIGGDIFLHLANQLSLDHNSLITATSGGQGRGGNITIDPQQTTISNASGITVNSTGTGNAGQLKISSNNLTLNNGGFLSANTKGGEGGSIFLNAQNLQLRHSSLFTAAAQGSGNGGNISINTGTLAVLENSPITANAFKGRGGNIQINAQGVFHSPDSLITASSQLGINGTVQVNTLVNNSTLGLVRLPIVPVDAAKLIAQGCGANTGPRGNKFVVTGSGGLPPEPTDLQTGDTGIQADWVETTAPVGENRASSSSPKKSHHSDPDDDDDFVEATGMIRNAKGQIEFVAQAPTYTPSVPWIKSPSCHAR